MARNESKKAVKDLDRKKQKSTKKDKSERHDRAKQARPEKQKVPGQLRHVRDSQDNNSEALARMTEHLLQAFQGQQAKNPSKNLKEGRKTYTVYLK